MSHHVNNVLSSDSHWHNLLKWAILNPRDVLITTFANFWITLWLTKAGIQSRCTLCNIDWRTQPWLGSILSTEFFSFFLAKFWENSYRFFMLFSNQNFFVKILRNLPQLAAPKNLHKNFLCFSEIIICNS